MIKSQKNRNGLNNERQAPFSPVLLFLIILSKVSGFAPRKPFPAGQGHSPSSFFSFGTLLVASSIQLPSAECFSSSGLPTNTRSSRHGSSASFTNSAASTQNTVHADKLGSNSYSFGDRIQSQTPFVTMWVWFKILKDMGNFII